MIIEEIKKVGRYKYKLITDDKSFFLYFSDLKKYNLFTGMELSTNQYNKIEEEIIIPRGKKKALDLLSKFDYSESELSKKLSLSGFNNEVIGIIIDYIKKFNYLDDRRYAENYILYKGKSKSKKMILKELSQRGIDQRLVNDLVENDIDEEDAINKLIAKKLKISKNIDTKFINKLSAYLYRKGFDYDLINDKISKLRYDYSL